MKKALARVVDLLFGLPLMLLTVWPIRWRRRIAGPRDRGPAFLRTLFSVLLLVVYYVAAVEVVARGVQFIRSAPMTPPWRYVDDRYLYENHAFRAFGLRPGAEVRWGVAGFHMEGVEYLVNEHGCRGPALDPKGSSRKRVLCFGGSVTFGPGVPETDTWPAKLQAMAPEWSVMNCGIAGYMSPHILAFAQGSLFDLEPDLIIVYTGRNDMHMNESFDPKRFRPDYQHSHGPRREPEGLRKWLIRHSFVFCTVARWQQSASNALGRAMRRRGPPIEVMGPRGIAAFSRNIEDLLALAKRRDIPVLLASEAPGYEPTTLPDGSPNPHLEHLDREAPGCAPEVYTQGLTAYGDALKATGAPYVDTVRILKRHPSLYSDSIHCNGAGAAELARMLLPEARKLLVR